MNQNITESYIHLNGRKYRQNRAIFSVNVEGGKNKIDFSKYSEGSYFYGTIYISTNQGCTIHTRVRQNFDPLTYREPITNIYLPCLYAENFCTIEFDGSFLTEEKHEEFTLFPEKVPYNTTIPLCSHPTYVRSTTATPPAPASPPTV